MPETRANRLHIPAVMLLIITGFVASTTAAPPAIAQSSPTPLPRGGQPHFTMLYQAGWNIVSGGALNLDIAGYGVPGAIDSPVYALSADGRSYCTVTQNSRLIDSQGYWMHFAKPVSAILSTHTGTIASLLLPAGQWVMVGNSESAAVQIVGADLVYVFNPSFGYQSAATLQPGQGAWMYSAAGATVQFASVPS